MAVDLHSHEGYRRFMKDLRKKASLHGVKIKLRKSEFVQLSDQSVSSGYFSSEDLELAASTYGDAERQIGLIVHESCHLDQFADDPFLWAKCDPGYTLFFEWIESRKIVTRERLEESVQDIIRLELDCELRSIKKIIKYKLPVDIEKYIQQSNAYLFGYLYFLEKRKWIPAISQVEAVWTQAPKKHFKSYTKIPVKLRKAFDREFN